MKKIFVIRCGRWYLLQNNSGQLTWSIDVNDCLQFESQGEAEQAVMNFPDDDHIPNSLVTIETGYVKIKK